MISLFDLYSIGIGPSSSHTMGPMRAAVDFIKKLQEDHRLKDVNTVTVDLYGSLALTGKGHGTDKAVILGLSGFLPEEVLPEEIAPLLKTVADENSIKLNHKKEIHFSLLQNIIFHHDEFLPAHPNGMRFQAQDLKGEVVHENIYYSIGGGFIVDEASIRSKSDALMDQKAEPPFPFTSAKTLLAHCEKEKCSIAELMRRNEVTWRSAAKIEADILNLWHVMNDSIERGCVTPGELPGGLHVKRRAPPLYQKLIAGEADRRVSKSLKEMDFLSLYALAVNEENAAGGRIVTAPTNGAAGIIPAVLKYYVTFFPAADDQGICDFLLTAAAIGILYKINASISAAEVGCQGEVGVACSMAAGALAAVQGGTLAQVENAAEIAMEHHLGLTCDPIAGLVQIPCIERNAMGAVHAVNAARLALLGEGNHIVSLDKVIAAMWRTGKAMSTDFKETAKDGLAYPVNLPEC